MLAVRWCEHVEDFSRDISGSEIEFSFCLLTLHCSDITRDNDDNSWMWMILRVNWILLTWRNRYAIVYTALLE